MTHGFKLSVSAVLAGSALIVSGSTAPVWAAASGGVMQKDSLAQEQPLPAGVLQAAQAIEIVRDEIFPALGSFGLGDFLKTLHSDSASYSQKDIGESGPVWNVFITNENPKSLTKPTVQLPLAYFSAVLDAKTGKLLSFEVKNPEWQGNQWPSREVATAKANAFLQTFEPDLFPELQLETTPTGGSINSAGGGNGQSDFYAYRTLNYYQKVNGVPFLTNLVSVNVDSFGNIVGLRKQLASDSSLLPEISDALPLAQAQQMYAAALQMQKYYVTDQSTPNASGVMTWNAHPELIYLPAALGPIDATTGQFQSAVPAADAVPTLTARQVNATGDLWNVQNLPTVEQMITRFTQTDVSHWNYRAPAKDPNQPDLPDLTLEWDGPSTVPVNRIFATEDAASGELISLRKIGDQASKSGTSATASAQPKLTLQQGEAVAEQFLQTLLPNGQQEVFLSSERDNSLAPTVPSWFDPSRAPKISNSNAAYSYRFHLGYEGVPILDQTIAVDLDPVTGAIIGFNRTVFHAVNLPENKGTVSSEQVKQNFLAAHPLELYYVWPQYQGQWAPNGELLYGVDPFASGSSDAYDAFTGQPALLQP